MKHDTPKANSWHLSPTTSDKLPELTEPQIRELTDIASPDHTVVPICDRRGFQKKPIISLLGMGLIREWRKGDPRWKAYLITEKGQRLLETQSQVQPR